MARGFTGSRNGTSGSSSIAIKVIRETLRKGGSINEETFKKIVKLKMEYEAEARAKAFSAGGGSKASMMGKMAQNKPLSSSAQKTMELVEKMRLEKKAKKAKKEVVIVARRFSNGKIDDKGRIRDTAGNIVAKVNLKNGTMTAINGQNMGVYNAKSAATANAIVDAINKNSPFLINQRNALLAQKRQDEQSYYDSQSASSTSYFWSSSQTDVWGNPMS